MTDPTAHAVLLDALCSVFGYTREQAEEAAKYAGNLGAVRLLLMPTEGAEVSYNEYEGMSCNACGEYDFRGHTPECAVLRAWEAIDHPRGHAAVGLAFDRARPVRPMRSEVPQPWDGVRIHPGNAATGEATGMLRLDAALTVAAGAGRVTLPAIAHHPCTHARREQRHVRLPGIPLEPMVEVACIDCGAVLETRTEADEIARANRASPPPRP